jgi:hypothetical protein
MSQTFNQLINLGDSWAAGHGVSEHCRYANLLADKYQAKIIDLSESGDSLGVVLWKFIKYLENHQLTEQDLVLVTMPPDIRWYQWSKFSRPECDFNGMSISGNHDSYIQFLDGCNADTGWFKAHAGLFCTYIINHCKLHNIQILIQHNYGTLTDIPEPFATQLKQSVADYDHSMWNWLGLTEWQDNYADIHVDGPPGVPPPDNSYMLPNDNHPNQAGHSLIAEKLYEIFNQRMG